MTKIFKSKSEIKQFLKNAKEIINYQPYALLIEKTIHGRPASEIRGFTPTQNQKLTDIHNERVVNQWEIITLENSIALGEGDHLPLAIQDLIELTIEAKKNSNDYSRVFDKTICLNGEYELSHRLTKKINKEINEILIRDQPELYDPNDPATRGEWESDNRRERGINN